MTIFTSFRLMRNLTLISVAVTLAIVATWSTAAHAETAAEGDQKNSLRTSLVLEGGYPEYVAVGSKVTAGDNEMLYAALNAPNGIFWSDDFAATWNAPTGDADFGNIIDVHTSETPGTAFMVGGISLYRTQDNGQSWVELPEVQDVSQFFATGADGLVVVPTRQNTIAISNDDGETFTTVELSNVQAVSVTANNNILAIVGGETEEDDNTLYIYEEGPGTFGATALTGSWTEIATHPTQSNFWVLSGSNTAQYTENGVDGPLQSMTEPENLSNAGAAVIRPSGRIYLGGAYSDDNGATWNQSGVHANWVSFDDVNQYVYTKNSIGVGRSTDDGETFSDAVTGLTAVTVNDMDQDDTKEVVWLAAQGGFAKSENFASSIAAGVDPTWEFPIVPSQDVDSGSAVLINKDEPDIVVVGAGGSMYITADAGTTWAPMTTGLDSGNRPTIRQILANNDGVLYASYSYTEGGESGQEVGGGVLTSADAGDTWTDMGLANVPAGPMAIDASGGLLVGVGVEQDDTAALRGLYYYDGVEWTHQSSLPEHSTYQQLIVDVMYIPEMEVMVATSSGADQEGELFFSEDFNAWSTWSVFAAEGIPSDFWGQALTYNPNNPNQFYASTARPSGTGQIYSCVLTEDDCKVYYTGLKDETFNTIYFDGLVTGSNTGIYSYKTKASINVTKKKALRRIVARLKDITTSDSLNGRSVRLFHKKKGGSFTLLQKKKVKKGKAVFKVGAKSGTFKVRWTPKKEDALLYDAAVSKNVKFGKK